MNLKRVLSRGLLLAPLIGIPNIASSQDIGIFPYKDFPPNVGIFIEDHTGMSARVIVSAMDRRGSNKGIKKLFLYEDEKEIASGGDGDGWEILRKDRKHDKPGTRTYVAKAIDYGDNVSWSKKVVIDYRE